MAEAPRVPLRRRLLLLAAAGLVPVVIMSGVGLYALARQQRTQAERIGLELARALATAVDAELRSSISVLQSLATTVEIDPKNLTAFRQEVQPVLETQPTWAALFLADPSGHRLVDTRFPLDATLPTVFETASFQRVVRTRAATVGGLARGADGVMLFAVRAPVLRAGRVEYVLTALVKPDGILNVITRQRSAPRLDHLDLRRERSAGRSLAVSRGDPRRAGVGEPADPDGDLGRRGRRADDRPRGRPQLRLVQPAR
jgi:hypothetical protein